MNLNTGGWPSPLLRLVARLRSDGLNSTTPVTEINGGNISATNADIALVVKGNGATLAQVPDGTATGGNKRGGRAIDWQRIRTAATQVASGDQSFIGSGQQNTASDGQTVVVGGNANLASGNQAAILGGNTNTASGVRSCAVAGFLNTASGSHSYVGGGESNTASSNYSFIGGGQNNTAQTSTHATVCGGNYNVASGQYSSVGGGQYNGASGLYSFIGGGYFCSAGNAYSAVCGGYNNQAGAGSTFIGGGYTNTANSAYSAIMGGRRGITRSIAGYHVFPACNIPIADAAGVTQSGLLLLARETTGNTATVLTSDSSAAGTTNQVILPNNAAYYFRGSVIANVTAGGDTKAWTFEGAIKRGATAATTAIVDTVVLNVIAQDAGAAAWSVAITADTVNGGIAVTVTGAASTTIRWVAKIETTEVTY